METVHEQSEKEENGPVAEIDAPSHREEDPDFPAFESASSVDGGGGGPSMPHDEFNKRLVENCHPPKWVNPKPANRYNMVVIGGGAAGLVTAAGSAGLGAKVALVERSLLGGDCLNAGCVPSKALLRCARAVSEIRNAGRLGISVDQNAVQINFAEIMQRMRRLRCEMSPNDSAQRFQSLGVDVFLGTAKFTGRNTIELADHTRIVFKKACIATGSRPRIPDIPGLKEAGFLTNWTIFNLAQQPARMAIIGSGPEGCELAQSFQMFGCQVTLCGRSNRLLPREDPDASKVLEKVFLTDGIALELGIKYNRVYLRNGATGGRSEKVLEVQTADGSSHEIAVDVILLACGRVPNIEDLGLEAAGVRVDPGTGTLRVNDCLKTTNSSIFAAGDVVFKHKFTHTANATARIVIRNALFFGRAKASVLNVPWCTYTFPEVAHVGLTEEEARQQNLQVTRFVKQLADVDRAILDQEEEGFVAILTKKGTDQIVGCTIVAAHAGDLISHVTTSMAAKFGLKSMAGVIFPYPTQAEAIQKIGDDFNRTRLTPIVKKLLKLITQISR